MILRCRATSVLFFFFVIAAEDCGRCVARTNETSSGDSDSPSAAQTTAKPPGDSVSPSAAQTTAKLPGGSVSPSAAQTTAKPPGDSVSPSATQTTAKLPGGSVSPSAAQTTAKPPGDSVSPSAAQTTAKPPGGSVSPSATPTIAKPPGDSVSPSATQTTEKLPGDSVSPSAAQTTAKPPGGSVSPSATPTTAKPPGDSVSPSVAQTTAKPPGDSVSPSVAQTTAKPPGGSVSPSATPTIAKPPGDSVSPSATQTTAKPPGDSVSPSAAQTTAKPPGGSVSPSAAQTTEKPPGDSVSPSAAQTTAKLPGGSVSPSATQTTAKPPGDSVSPSAAQTTAKPPGGSVSPSATPTIAKPPGDSVSPSVAQTTAKPPGDSVSPSAAQTTAKPPGDSVSPSAAQTTAKPPGDSVSPSAAQTTAKPAGGSVSPSVAQTSATPGGSVSPSVAQTSATPTGASVSPSVAQTSATPTGASVSPSVAQTSATPPGGSVSPSVAQTSATPPGGSVNPSVAQTSAAPPGASVSPSLSPTSTASPESSVIPSVSPTSSASPGELVISSVSPSDSISFSGLPVPPPSTTSTSLGITSTIMSSSRDIEISPSTTFLTTLGITPTPIIKEPTRSSSMPTQSPSNEVSVYEMNCTFTNITKRESSNPEHFTILKRLITECSKDFTTEGSVYFVVCQKYMKEVICEIYEDGNNCYVNLKSLECGSLKVKLEIRLSNNSIEKLEQKIEEGKLGAFPADKTSCKSRFVGKSTKPTPTANPPQVDPSVFVVIKMRYSWGEFCSVVSHFQKGIAKVANNLNENKLEPEDIYIINRDTKCENTVQSTEEIEVQFVVLGKKQNKITIQAGKKLKDLVESKKTDELGNFFEGKIIWVKFEGKDAPISSSKQSSDNETTWLIVGISLGILLILLLLWLCCCRQTKTNNDPERDASYFAMDEMDNEKRPDTVLVNEGFDGDNLSRGVSTFTDGPEDGNKPVSRSKDKEPLKNDSRKAPLGEGEDTDDELGMTVPDVAIEPDSSANKKAGKPPGTQPIIPPEPAHMAIKDLPAFFKESANESQKSKEYEDLDKTMTPASIYPNNTGDRNRLKALVPKKETRVRLSSENDYINASFVKDHHGNGSFIVTQHPLSNTMRDFWSMVWEQNVAVVVMVNDKDKDLENYHNYWLNHKNSLTIYGHMQVKTQNVDSNSGFNVTKFVLQNSQQSDVRKTVTHFRFADWAENDTPSVLEFSRFVEAVEGARLEKPKQPVVVHCSDGQGYAGVIIATVIGLHVYQESDKKSTINVFDCVEKMRKDRNGIVCSKDLYNFIFKVLSTLVTDKQSTDSKL